MRRKLTVAVIGLAAAVAMQGCAVGMLKGAAGSGGGSGTSQPSTRTSSQIAADSAISTSVRSRLATNAALRGLNIAVDTHDGVVTLRGRVAKVEQKNAADMNARSVQGVRSVQNLLTVP
jgi:hyperosmotically inducible periplasmic protein